MKLFSSQNEETNFNSKFLPFAVVKEAGNVNSPKVYITFMCSKRSAAFDEFSDLHIFG